MPNTDEEIIRDWRSALEKTLREEKRNDIIIPYSEVSFAFPGGPHSSSFDLQRIDSEMLKPWAENLGWHVQTAPEATHPTQLDTPFIRFTRIVQG